MTTDTKGKAGLRSGLAVMVGALEILSSVVIVIMMVLTFIDVIGRYVFAQPIFGASEMISALLAVAIFAGLGVANARDDHIVVELMDHHVRRISPFFYEVVIQGFSVLVMGIVAYVLFEMALEVWHQNTRTFVLEMPLFWIAGTVSFLATLSCVSQIIGIYLKFHDDFAATEQDGQS